MARELDIIRLYDRNLRGFFTIRGIAKELNLAYPYVHRLVHKLMKLGVLRSAPVGGSHCLSIDLRNRRAILYLTEIELEKRAQLPANVATLAKQLDKDGTLAIETAIYGNGIVYLVGSGSFSGAKTITRDELKELLLTTDIFQKHVVIHGYERFFNFLSSIQPALDEVYNPLVTLV